MPHYARRTSRRAASEDGGELIASLRDQEVAWNERPLVRTLYREWHESLVERLASVAGLNIELGSGIGRLREVSGDRVILTDIEQTPWADRQVDALNLPYEAGELANILMLDVFHHLANVARFLDEAQRTLAPKGRVVMIEPYCSPLSTILYRRFHHERIDLDVDPYATDALVEQQPLDSNQALPTLVFYRHLEAFRRRWTRMRVIERRRLALFAYPLSGGFSGRRLLPFAMYRPARLIERVLGPLSPMLAFRCLVVLEKVDMPTHGSA